MLKPGLIAATIATLLLILAVPVARAAPVEEMIFYVH
jgi:hypothetical protein